MSTLGLFVWIGLLSGPDCLSAGVDAARAKNWDDAFRAFRAARARPGCDTPPLLFNLARAGEKVVENGDAALACEIAERYAEFMGTEPAPALAKLATEGRSKMAIVCAARASAIESPAPRPAPVRKTVTATPSHALEWGLTTSAIVAAIGSGATYFLARNRIDERDAASAQFAAATARNDFAAAQDAELDYQSHRDASKFLGITSYALGGTAVVLTGLAIWAWAVEDDAPASTAVITPNFIGWGGQF